MSDAAELPRETGSEKAEASCPICKGPVPVVQSPYGSLIAGACPNCSAKDGDQLVAQQAAAAEAPVGAPAPAETSVEPPA